MNHSILTLDDLRYLEHLRNIGHLVSELTAEQDNVTLRRDPAERLQLISLIYLMTDQLDAVIERCNRRWLDGEEKV
ncbi:hypothetical protein SAMN05216168_2654 [Kosakonia radicincitans]|uniref:hypothetical protein n=1 Tax=Kosakonia radicincitans TaxID=283686 RepID=UPI0009A56D2C|nr:hypothetical protein [Kosakonia radicincitans]SKC18358.1 hypothetical protein SAMN05216168_2654 [Kosakonia radicincitans]